MPNFGNPITQRPIRHIGESSAQRSPRDADSVSQQWKSTNTSAFGVYQVQSAVKSIQLELARLKRRIVGQVSAPPAGGMNFRGYWVDTTQYALNDVVVIQAGVSAGLYISLIAANANDPATGTGWMQIAPGNMVGSWT